MSPTLPGNVFGPVNIMAGPLRAIGIEAGEILENSRTLSALAEKVGHLLI